jgi:hypothetical protein
MLRRNSLLAILSAPRAMIEDSFVNSDRFDSCWCNRAMFRAWCYLAAMEEVLSPLLCCKYELLSTVKHNGTKA